MKQGVYCLCPETYPNVTIDGEGVHISRQMRGEARDEAKQQQFMPQSISVLLPTGRYVPLEELVDHFLRSPDTLK